MVRRLDFLRLSKLEEYGLFSTMRATGWFYVGVLAFEFSHGNGGQLAFRHRNNGHTGDGTTGSRVRRLRSSGTAAAILGMMWFLVFKCGGWVGSDGGRGIELWSGGVGTCLGARELMWR
jgi:hypothetical protein